MERLDSAQERKATVTLLHAIAAKEEHLRADLSGRFWMYFDLKKGLSAAAFKLLKEREAEWIQAKLRLVSFNIEEQSIDGFGDRVLSQLLSSNHLSSDMVKVTVTRNWVECFAQTFAELLWMCAGRTPKFT